jgi:hypothetical protein
MMAVGVLAPRDKRKIVTADEAMPALPSIP